MNKSIVKYQGTTYLSTPEYDLVTDENTDCHSIDNLPIQFLSKTIIIDSINSGTGRDKDRDIYSKLLKPLFDALGITYEYYKTTTLTSIQELARSIIGDVYLIFISGDTSISEFINAIPRSYDGQVYISVIPAGTGNALSCSLDVFDPITAVSSLFHDKCKKMPIYQVSFNCSLNITHQDQIIGSPFQSLLFFAVFSWLFHALLVADSDTPELRKLGSSRFGIAAKQNLELTQIYPAQIKDLDDKDIIKDTNHSYLTLTPLKRFEQKFDISPIGNLDNLYMIETCSDIQGDQLMQIMMQLYDNGKHVNHDDVNYIDVSAGLKLFITDIDVSKLRFCLDGSIIKLSGTKDIEITMQRYDTLRIKLII